MYESVNKRLHKAAASSSRASEIKALLAQGAQIDYMDENGMTAVMLACQYNTHTAVLKALIQAGADIRQKEPNYKSDCLLLAANKSSNPRIIEVLLENGADLENRNYLGETALIMAVKTNPACAIAKALIKAGSCIDAKDYQGHDALYFAIEERRPSLIKALRT